MPSWKAPVFVTAVSALPAVVYTFWLRSRLNTVSTAVGSVLYIWFLSRYTLAYFRNPLRLQNIPSPSTSHFILGNAPEAIARPPASAHLRWAKAIPNDGLITFTGFFHHKLNLIATSPEVLREILIEKPHDFIKPKPPLDFVRRIVGDGLVTIDSGEQHKLRRKLVNPAFHGSYIKELMPLFWRKGSHLCNAISREIANSDSTATHEGVVEIAALAARTTLDVIGLAGVGQDFNTLDNDDNQIAKDFSTLTDTTSSSLFYLFLGNMILGRRLASIVFRQSNRAFNRINTSLRSTAIQLMKDKRESVEKNADNHVDIISLLMQEKSPLNDLELTDELLTFLAAGSETTSSALTWLCYFLAKDPDVQQRVREEVSRCALEFNIRDGPTAESLDPLTTLPYLNAVCNESLRLFPPVPFNGRVTARPTTLLGYSIPAGVGVEVSPFVINRLPALWGEDAEEFVPERWLAEGCTHTGGAADPLAFGTFSHGSRGCIGKEFARTELKCLIANIVLRFEFELEDKNHVPVHGGFVTVKPINGLKLRLREL